MSPLYKKGFGAILTVCHAWISSIISNVWYRIAFTSSETSPRHEATSFWLFSSLFSSSSKPSLTIIFCKISTSAKAVAFSLFFLRAAIALFLRLIFTFVGTSTKLFSTVSLVHWLALSSPCDSNFAVSFFSSLYFLICPLGQ